MFQNPLHKHLKIHWPGDSSRTCQDPRAALISILSGALGWSLMLPEFFPDQGSSWIAAGTGIALFAGAALVIFLMKCVFCIRWPLYFITCAFFLTAPVLGISIGILPILLLLISLIFLGPIRFEKIWLPAGIFVLVFLLAFGAVWAAPQAFYQRVYDAEGFVYRTFFAQRASAPIASGHVSGENNYPSGDVQIEVTVSRRPEETMYLKAFSGGDYVGGQWESADDEALFVNMSHTLEWEEWLDWIRGLYANMYYVMNDQTAGEGTPEAMQLHIRHLDGDYSAWYTPYYGFWDLRRNNYEEGYAFNAFQQSEMDIHWDYADPIFQGELDWYIQVRDTYMDEIQTAYTHVPEDLVPRLAQLCRDHPLEGTDAVTAFIFSVLDNAAYTRTPGRTPQNTDVVEYFLFDHQRGYCVHFASAAVLMYRMYGIPARYATGYAIPDENFILQEDGTWKAYVTDEYAHAWPEIFLPDYGWTPVEVTPSGSEAPGYYPGFNMSALNEFPEAFPIFENSQSAEAMDGGSGETAASAGRFLSDLAKQLVKYLKDHEQLWWAVGAILAETVAMIPVFFILARLWAWKRLEQSRMELLFSKYIRLLYFAGLEEVFTGQEEDFPEKAFQQIPAVSSQEVKEVVSIVSQAAFGRKMPDAGQQEYVLAIYRRSAAWVDGQLSRPRRWVFRYIRHFW